jgi:hypothetical protein
MRLIEFLLNLLWGTTQREPRPPRAITQRASGPAA